LDLRARERGRKLKKVAKGVDFINSTLLHIGIMAIKSGRITYVEHVARMRVKKFL
jgi:hypothetical protein